MSAIGFEAGRIYRHEYWSGDGFRYSTDYLCVKRTAASVTLQRVGAASEDQGMGFGYMHGRAIVDEPSFRRKPVTKSWDKSGSEWVAIDRYTLVSARAVLPE